MSRAPASKGQTLKAEALVAGLGPLKAGTWQSWVIVGAGSGSVTPGPYQGQGSALPGAPLLTVGARSPTATSPSLSLLSFSGKFLKTATVPLLSPALSLMALPLTGPGAADCNTCPASFPPLPCRWGTGSSFLPGRSLGGKLVRPRQSSCLGGLKGAGGCGNNVPLLCLRIS